MTTSSNYPPSSEVAAKAHIDAAKYEEMYAASINDPEAFWGEHGKRIDWIKPYTKVKNTNYDFGSVSINWYEDGTLNIAANCIDRHLATVAIKPPSFGNLIAPTTKPSTLPTSSCMKRFPVSATCCAIWA